MTVPGSRVPGVALLLALAVGVAACGGSASDASPGGGSTGGGAFQGGGTDNGSATGGGPGPGVAGHPGTTGAQHYRSPNALAVGDCFDPIDDAKDGAFLAALVLPCSSPHRHEVFGLPELAGAPATPFPGRDELDRQARDLCGAAFESYVGIPFDRSGYGYTYYAPAESQWAAGERTVWCVIDAGTLLTGSVKGARQ